MKIKEGMSEQLADRSIGCQSGRDLWDKYEIAQPTYSVRHELFGFS
jgi:hypothetical protein